MNAQTICRALGESGCYFFCLLRLVHKENDAIQLYRQCVQAGALDEDCYVRNPSAVLSMAAGGAWAVRHATPTYKPVTGEHEILRYERKATGTTSAHFVVGDGNGRVVYDPLDDSRTVREGTVVSKRIVSRLA